MTMSFEFVKCSERQLRYEVLKNLLGFKVISTDLYTHLPSFMHNVYPNRFFWRSHLSHFWIFKLKEALWGYGMKYVMSTTLRQKWRKLVAVINWVLKWLPVGQQAYSVSLLDFANHLDFYASSPSFRRANVDEQANSQENLRVEPILL